MGPQAQALEHIAWRKTTDGRLTWVSPNWSAAMGISDPIGRPAAEILPELAEHVGCIDRAALTAGHAVRMTENRSGVWVAWQHLQHPRVIGGGAVIFISAPTIE
jgi:hypothetical protein